MDQARIDQLRDEFKNFGNRFYLTGYEDGVVFPSERTPPLGGLREGDKLWLEGFMDGRNDIGIEIEQEALSGYKRLFQMT